MLEKSSVARDSFNMGSFRLVIASFLLKILGALSFFVVRICRLQTITVCLRKGGRETKLEAKDRTFLSAKSQKGKGKSALLKVTQYRAGVK